MGCLPPFHAFGLTTTTILPLLLGLRVVYHPNPTEGRMLARLIEAYRRGMEAVRFGHPTQNVTIRDCTLISSLYAGIGLGTEMSGGIRNVHVENCFIAGRQNGISLKSRDGRGGLRRSELRSGGALTPRGWSRRRCGRGLCGTTQVERQVGSTR